MNRRTRSVPTPTTSPSFHRYLKPGALARLRDSKITTTTTRSQSHRIHAIATTSFNRSPSSSPPVPASPAANNLQIDAPPSFFSGRMCYGPRYLQRKKLVAARSLSYLMPASPAAAEIGDVDLFGADVAAH